MPVPAMDMFDLAPGAKENQSIFYAQWTAGAPWQTWRKPVGCTMASIICVGGGAGGGGGAGNAAGQPRGGGAGGGSSGVSRYIYPLDFLPDTLYALVGHGGIGGAAGSTGNGVGGFPGNISIVGLYPGGTTNNLYCHSGAAATAGGGGTASAGGTGGNAGGIATIADAPFSQWAVCQFLAGKAGANGGAHTGANGANVALGTAAMIMPGTGGAGTTNGSFTGGVYSAVASTPFLVTTAAPAGGDGSGGFRFNGFPLLYGGSGGGASNSVPGGAGGNGGDGRSVFGTGGGGGGGGVTTGGRGGDGGPGIVIITCW